MPGDAALLPSTKANELREISVLSVLIDLGFSDFPQTFDIERSQARWLTVGGREATSGCPLMVNNLAEVS
jgi:hypothetical protein